MQLNYSYLKIWKFTLSFCSQFFVSMLLFLSLSFSTRNPQFLSLVFLKRSMNWPKIRNGLPLQNNQFIKRGNFVTDMKILNFLCVDLILPNSKFTIISSLFDAFKMIFLLMFRVMLLYFYMVLMLRISIHRISV